MSKARTSLVRTALLAFVCWGMLGADAEAQTFLRNRDFLNLGHPESYLNYGRKEYDPYPAVINARNRYDRLGNYLSRGFNVFTWEFCCSRRSWTARYKAAPSVRSRSRTSQPGARKSTLTRRARSKPE